MQWIRRLSHSGHIHIRPEAEENFLLLLLLLLLLLRPHLEVPPPLPRLSLRRSRPRVLIINLLFDFGLDGGHVCSNERSPEYRRPLR